jgi:hypothetical protein
MNRSLLIDRVTLTRDDLLELTEQVRALRVAAGEHCNQLSIEAKLAFCAASLTDLAETVQAEPVHG